MKKLISAIVIAAMLMCGIAAFAETEQNICGNWYVSYVITADGIISAPGDAGFTQTFVVNEDGSCSFGFSAFNSSATSADGEWYTGDDGVYEMKFAGDVEFRAVIAAGLLVVNGSDGSMYYCSSDPEDAQRVISFAGYSADAADTDFFGDWVCAAALYTGENGNYEYYSKNILPLDFTVSIGLAESSIGGYYANWHIGGVGEQVYNEDIESYANYEIDQTGDAFMYSMFILSNGANPTAYMFLDAEKQTMHVYGIYGILVFTKSDAPLERPALIEAVIAEYTEQ